MRTAIGVVVPVRDGARYLAATLDSIAAQSRPADEVVVVDDGSTDGSGAIAASHALGARVVVQAPSGAAAARNAGIAVASAARLAFLDADDLWSPDHLAVLEAALDAASPAVMAFGHLRQFASPDLPPDEVARLAVPDGPEPGFVLGAMLAERAAFDRAGLLDPTLRAGEAIAWLLAAREAGLAHVMVADVVLHRRLHAANMGRTQPDFRRDYLRVVRAELHRRRQGPGR